MKKIFVLIFLVATLFLVGCKPDDGGETPSEKEPLKVCVTYQGKAYISYNQTEPYEAPDGNTYRNGDLLSMWIEYGNLTNVDFTDVTPGGGKKEADILKEAALDGFRSADIYNGKVVDLNNYGVQGDFVALNEYWDQLPDLKAFLDANPSLLMSLTAADGNIYYAPYFDGMDEVERSFYLRYDWVEKLLDTTPVYDTGKTMTTVYDPFYPNGIDTIVTGTTKNITKQYTGEENIIAIQNALETKNGQTLTEALKTYITDVYGSQYDNPSELFLGGDAAYDADELVALMRCVKANPLLLTGDANSDIAIFIPRDTGSSRVTLMNCFESIWGVKGCNGDNTLYIDKDGNLKDGASDQEAFEGLQMMNELYQEGLILQNYDTKQGEVSDWRGVYMFTNGTAFMTFDYNQTTTALYDAKEVAAHQDNPALSGLCVRAVLPAVADWDDGTDNNFIHYSQFTRAIKTEGWGISAYTESNPDKLAAALRVVNFPYTERGEVLVTWGPDAWIDGEMEYSGTNGVEMIPRISDRARQEINDLTNGNLTNYYRYYVGSTFAIGHVRHMGFEYQILNNDGLWSASMINNAIAAGAMVINTSAYDEDTGYFSLTAPVTWSLSAEALAQIEAEASQASAVYTDNKHRFIMIGAGNVDANDVQVPTYAEYCQLLTDAHYYDIWLSNYEATWNRMKLEYLE